MSHFNQENPRISIGMPVYNGEKYIQDALDTLLNQSYAHFELIISDNASSDNTEAICQKYAKHDVRIRYFRQTSNIGAAANFKFVLQQAEGAYFMWAACDDKWSIDWLKEMLDALIATHAEMAFGRVTHIDANGQPLHHPANNASFSYAASPLIRRVKFYLDYEGLGKANIICCLYAIRMRSELSRMLDECISGACRFDYTLIYNSLQHGRQVKAKNAFIYKRVHNMSEGDKYSERPEYEALYVKIGRKMWPFFPGLLSDYLKHASSIEKVILILLFPLKLLNAYLFGIKKYLATLGGTKGTK